MSVVNFENPECWPFIFLGGVHRSGTSLLHQILRAHPSISGFSNTGVPEDEGQHLQTVYRPARDFGGPGRFAFDFKSHMDEGHALANPQAAREIAKQWAPHFDLSKQYLIEKSPPNIVRTRFLQKLYPESRFIIILRHPLAVALATYKWNQTSLLEQVRHALLAYETLIKDQRFLNRVLLIRYEDFVSNPNKELKNLEDFLRIPAISIDQEVNPEVNQKYFEFWESKRRSFLGRLRYRVDVETENRLNSFGYSATANQYTLAKPALL